MVSSTDLPQPVLSDTVLTTLKSVDPDRYRSALFADTPVRARLLLLYAFHYELAKVPELVSDPMIGAIRYQWWREAIDEIYTGKTVRKHEIVSPLAKMFRTSNMPRFWVDTLIDARARDLDPRPFSNLSDARSYCQQTSGVLMQMAVQLTGGNADISVECAGEAWGLTGLARAWGYYHNTMLSQLTFDDVCEAANAAHRKGRKLSGKIMARDMPALAYAALVPKYLVRLTDSHYDPLIQPVSYSPFLKRLRLMGAVITARV